ncbi:hypothetical protein BT63DRAFT_420867 [Microthyrium microscopicum]|uniref:Uncharacterized protein n=1 Tax=Microthyrium microscopicum TaxID=703497 RepID=A0A6A6UMI0_9PEZI|nr:hypothetical protein BT63DRAFT_420867 [Microthyrium microscopicum]
MERDNEVEGATSEDVIMSGVDPVYDYNLTADKAKDEIANCRLMSLPFELRKEIWKLCLSNGNNPISWPDNKKTGNQLGTALLRTNKTIYADAVSILYSDNIPLFIHPSDANMFLYANNIKASKRVESMMVKIKDRDLPLWTGYFNSTVRHRSLQWDYPELKDLYIVLRSSPHLSQIAPDLLQAYNRWKVSSSLHNLCGSLVNIIDRKVCVKVIFMRLATPHETEQLFEACPETFNPYPRDAPGPRLRSKWIDIMGAQVALDGTADSHPWETANVF